MKLNEFTSSEELAAYMNESLKEARQRSLDLVNKYNNKFLVYDKLGNIIGQYNTGQEAYDKGIPEVGIFLIQEISLNKCTFCNIKDRRIGIWGTNTIVLPQLEVISKIPNQEEK